MTTAPPLPLPRRGTLLPTDLFTVLAGFTVIVLGLWVRHGGLRELTASWPDFWAALTQLTGLVASAAGLLGLALVARPRTLERR